VDAGLDEVIVLAPACSFETDRPRGAVARVERQMRRAATRRLAREVEVARAAGVRVTVLCPGPEDLEAIGGNVMDITRRVEVFETSLRTCGVALRGAAVGITAAGAAPAQPGPPDEVGLGLAG
jgi:NTE family protein